MTNELLDRVVREVDPVKLAGAAVALLAIGVLAAVLYAIKPAWQEYRLLKTRHAQTQQVLGPGGADVAESIEILEAEVSKLRDALYGGAAGVPRTEIESFVVDSLDRLSGRHGVSLRGITPDVPTSAWMFEELPYEVQVEGSYFAIHRWLYDVEEELRPMVVKQFQLTPRRNEEGVLLDLRVVAYRTPQEAGA